MQEILYSETKIFRIKKIFERKKFIALKHAYYLGYSQLPVAKIVLR